MSDSDPWNSLRKLTAARIALGRAGGSLPTRELLDFSLAHAEARDAVHAELDVDRVAGDLLESGLESIVLHSTAGNRSEFLKYPNLGRQLSEESKQTLSAVKKVGDISIVIGDGLSATATQRHAVAVAVGLTGQLAPFTFAPITSVRQARVAIQDEIGAILNAKLSIILLGERPGLGSADSLGAYLVYSPKAGNTDANRNCVSNIRPEGLAIPAAIETLSYLVRSALVKQLSGVLLKDDRLLIHQTDNDAAALGRGA